VFFCVAANVDFYSYSRLPIIMCEWPKKPLDKEYHDKEWGVPLHDDNKLFEFIVLDTFQAGLSWSTILHKRENFREAFENFNAKKIISFSASRIEKLMTNEGIIRNRLKINATVNNAKHFMRLQKEYGSFDKYIWRFTGHKPVINKWKAQHQVPATSAASDEMSKELYKEGFKFVGSTICYAFMQAAGMVNDHLVSCSRYQEVQAKPQK
jgi:DNA-3-methyladenine glycosylase I